MGATRTTTTPATEPKPITKEERLRMAKMQAESERRYAAGELRKLLEAVTERAQMFAEDTRREAERAVAYHERGERHPMETVSQRVSSMANDLRNFLSNQGERLERLERYARDIEQADRVLEVFGLLDEAE